MLRLGPEVLRLVKLAKDECADVIHTNGALNLHGLLAARFARRRSLWHLNDALLPTAMCRLMSRTYGALAQWKVYSSRFVAEWYGCRAVDDADVLYPPVDTETFDPALLDHSRMEALLKECRLAREGPRVVAVGNVNFGKGYEELIEAVAWLRSRGQPVTCLVVGLILRSQAAYWQRLQGVVGRLGLHGFVKFLGARSDVRTCLGLADVVVVASRCEALGMAALEASAMERPVVAVRSGGIPEAVIDGVTGILVESGNGPAIGEALMTVLLDRDLARRFGRKGREFVRERFHVDHAVAKHERLYAGLLRNAP
jgi:glycosyltransferase involved in cell wall biosynthesis